MRHAQQATLSRDKKMTRGLLCPFCCARASVIANTTARLCELILRRLRPDVA
jgi:hypothetical protein